VSAARDLVLVPAWAVRDRQAILQWIAVSLDQGEPGGTLSACGGDVMLDRSACTLTVDGSDSHLHASAFLLLELLLLSAGQPQRAEELAKMLWGDEAKSRSSNLRVVAHEVRRALGRHGANVRSVRGVGYAWVPTRDGCDSP